MSQKLNTAITVVGIDIGKNSFHVVGLDQRGAIALRHHLVGTDEHGRRDVEGAAKAALPQFTLAALEFAGLTGSSARPGALWHLSKMPVSKPSTNQL